LLPAESPEASLDLEVLLFCDSFSELDLYLMTYALAIDLDISVLVL